MHLEFLKNETEFSWTFERYYPMQNLMLYRCRTLLEKLIEKKLVSAIFAVFVIEEEEEEEEEEERIWVVDRIH